jgi:transcriptional regulator of acetoin/glycerol metabolism
VARSERRAGAHRDDNELEQLVLALRTARGNVSVAARQLGISRQRAYRLMNYLPGLDVDRLRQNRGEHDA